MIRATCIFAMAGFILSGCASFSSMLGRPLEGLRPESADSEIILNEAHNKTNVPSDWVVPAPDMLPTNDWVDHFGSAELSALVDEALLANTNIHAAAASYRAAKASLVSAQSNLVPSLDFSSRASRNQTDDTRNDNITLGLDSSWEADIWGRVGDTASAVELAADASRADFAAARLSIAGQTAQAWFNLIEARLLTDLAQRDLDTQQRILSLTQRRFERGVSASTDVRLARSSVAASEAVLASRRQQRASAARTVEILLRRYPANELEGALDLPRLPALDGAGQTGEVLARRPDLIAAEQRLASQGLRVDIARKNLLPRLNLTAGLDDSGPDIADLFDFDSLLLSIAANVSAPIFNAGALKADVREEQAQLERLVENYIASALEAYLDVENALDGETRLAEREAALRVSLDESRRAEERLARRYIEGLATILELLDSQTRALNAESQLISARKERLANRVRLHLALGGGDFGTIPTDEDITQDFAQLTP